MTKKLTTSEFIEKAIAKHGEVYDYSKVVYVGSQKKILIICPEHGEFKQKPASHLSGAGCAECGGSMPLTTETFIEKAITKHGEIYDYSKVVYVGSQKKILIICPEHGEFDKTPNDHLSGKGCAECSGKKQLTTETFIKKSIAKHGDAYDYSKVAYLNISTKIIIICPEHGEFKQKPASHLNGNGCAGCSDRTLTTETFIEKAITKHGETYDYSKVVYVGSQKKILIICQEHGEFEQTPTHHLNGNGCAGCAKSGFDSTKPAILYHICFKLTDSRFTHVEKIGITNNSVKKRFSKEDQETFDFYQEYPFENGIDALNAETAILKATKEHAIEKNDSPINDGWTEIRTCNLQPVLLGLLVL